MIKQSVPLIYKSVTQAGLRSTAVTSLIGNAAGITLIGGTATTADLTFQTTTGVGTTGADMHFLVGNNGATEAMTILNSGFVGIGTTGPGYKLDIIGNGYASLGFVTANNQGYGAKRASAVVQDMVVLDTGDDIQIGSATYANDINLRSSS